MTSTTEPLLQIPPIHWQLTQLECPTFLMSGGWQPQPGSRYPGCHAVLYTCHQHPAEGIQLPVNKMHVSVCTTICVYQYKQPYSQVLTCESEQKRQVHSVCASICQFSIVLMYLCIKLFTLATFLQVTSLLCMDILNVCMANTSITCLPTWWHVCGNMQKVWQPNTFLLFRTSGELQSKIHSHAVHKRL